VEGKPPDRELETGRPDFYRAARIGAAAAFTFLFIVLSLLDVASPDYVFAFPAQVLIVTMICACLAVEGVSSLARLFLK
jgi:hypothetical protein